MLEIYSRELTNTTISDNNTIGITDFPLTPYGRTSQASEEWMYTQSINTTNSK